MHHGIRVTPQLPNSYFILPHGISLQEGQEPLHAPYSTTKFQLSPEIKVIRHDPNIVPLHYLRMYVGLGRVSPTNRNGSDGKQERDQDQV